MEITGVSPSRIDTVIIFGGTLSNRKGVNLPNTLLPIPALTEKDRADLEAAASIGVDWIALSFVQRPEDVAEARELIAGRAGVMAKIEKPSALLCLEDILKVSDGIMVARGDLGVELPLETVPARQKQLTRAARRAGKPVVVATQMLESMIVEPVPTRAEVSDVATAVYEGADAIMLSAESAAGAWPEKAVATMDKIAQSAEGDSFYRGIMNAQRNDPQPTTADAISTAARSISETLAVAAIVSYTESGSTAMRVARERPNVPIITLTPIPATARRLALAWGQHCVLTPNADDLEHMIDTACQFASSEGFAEEGQRIIITVGVPLGCAGLQPTCCASPKWERRKRRDLNVPLALGQFLNGVLDPRHVGIHAQRFPESSQRGAPFSLPLVNHAAARKRPKVARFQIKNFVDIAKRGLIIAEREMQCGALVPGFRIGGIGGNDAVQNFKRCGIFRSTHGHNRLAQQNLCGWRIKP